MNFYLNQCGTIRLTKMSESSSIAAGLGLAQTCPKALLSVNQSPFDQSEVDISINKRSEISTNQRSEILPP